MTGAVKYANGRIQFKVPISSFGMIKTKLANMAIRTYMCDSMMYRLAGMFDDKLSTLDEEAKKSGNENAKALEEYAPECSITKVYGSEIADYCVDEYVQILGGYGFIAEYPAERERWFDFKDRCIYHQMMEWLESEGIEPTNPMERPEEPEPKPEEEFSRDVLIEDLTLLLIYLCSWEEHPLPDFTVHRAWKGYLFEVLDALEERGYIKQTRRAKSVTLTEEGLLRAEELEVRYAL